MVQAKPFTSKIGKIATLRISIVLFFMLRRELGFKKRLLFFKEFLNKKNEISRMKFSCMRGQNMKANRDFLNSISSQAAIYITLKKYLTGEKTLKYYDWVVKKGGVISLKNQFSGKLERKEPFEQLKILLTGMFKENKQLKSHDYEIAVSDRNTFQINVTMCLLYEMLKELGIPESCTSACEVDSIFFTEYLKGTDIKFSRKGTIAQGCKFCDFCFYVQSGPEYR
jgi:hypothetical protein